MIAVYSRRVDQFQRGERGERRVSGAKRKGGRGVQAEQRDRVWRGSRRRASWHTRSTWCIPFAASNTVVLLLIRGSYHNYIHIYTVYTALGLLRLSRVARWRVGHWRRASRIHRYKDLRSHEPGGYSFLHRRPSAAGQWVVQRGRELLSRVMGSSPW